MDWNLPDVGGCGSGSNYVVVITNYCSWLKK